MQKTISTVGPEVFLGEQLDRVGKQSVDESEVYGEQTENAGAVCAETVLYKRAALTLDPQQEGRHLEYREYRDEGTQRGYVPVGHLRALLRAGRSVRGRTRHRGSPHSDRRAGASGPCRKRQDIRPCRARSACPESSRRVGWPSAAGPPKLWHRLHATCTTDWYRPGYGAAP